MLTAKCLDLGIATKSNEGDVGGGGEDEGMEAHSADDPRARHDADQIGGRQMLGDRSAKERSQAAAEPTVLSGVHGHEQKAQPLSAKHQEPGGEDL